MLRYTINGFNDLFVFFVCSCVFVCLFALLFA